MSLVTINGEINTRYYLGDNDTKIINRVADEIEGLCCSRGYIIPGTTTLVSRSAPYLDKIENGGITKVIVKYQSKIISINCGDFIEVKITKVNRLGAMAEYLYEGHCVSTVLLPTDLQDDDVTMRVDHNIDIRVLDLRFGVGWDKITAVGKVVDDRFTKTHNHTESESKSEHTNIRSSNTVTEQW